jgi:hypothetical protein
VLAHHLCVAVAAVHRLPTLYLSECVLIYLEPGEAQRLLAAAAARTTDAGGCAAVAIYEQTRPDDAFGATMIANLEVQQWCWMQAVACAALAVLGVLFDMACCSLALCGAKHCTANTRQTAETVCPAV